MPLVIGLGLVIAIVAAIALIGRNQQNTSNLPDPYAASLQVSDLKLSAADNFIGATVTYLDMNLTNTGNRVLVGGQIEATFRNTLNEVVQKEVVPIHVLQPNKLGGYPDLIDLATSPLSPGQTKPVRVSLEHISADWNQNAPDIRFTNLRLK